MAGFESLSGLRGAIDPLLQGLVVKLANEHENFACEKGFPLVKSSSRNGTFLKYDAPAFLGDSQHADLARAPGALAKQLHISTSTGTFAGVEYSAEIPVADADIIESSNAGLDLLRDAAEILVNQLLIKKELLMWAAIGGFDASGLTNPWDNPSGDLMAELDGINRAILKASGKNPDTLIMSIEGMHDMRAHPDVTAMVVANGQTMASVTFEQLKQVLAAQFGYKQVLVSSAVYNSSAPGAAATGALCATADRAWVGYLGAGMPQSLTSAAALKCIGPQDFEARRYYSNERKCWVAELSSTFAFVEVSEEMGQLITNTET